MRIALRSDLVSSGILARRLLSCFLAAVLAVSSGLIPTPALGAAPPPTGAKPEAPPPAAAAPKTEPAVVGDWQGTLDVGGTKLRLAVHVTKNQDGTLKATLDSLDQGAMGIAVDKATFEGGTLRLDLGSISARFEGTLGKEGTELAGTWSQGGGSLPLTLTRGTTKEGTTAKAAPADQGKSEAGKPVASDPIKPMWMGTLDAGGTKLRLIFHLSRGGDGVIAATVDSLDQGAMGLAVDRAVYKEGKLTLELKQPPARFVGTTNKEGTELTGQWLQGGGSLPLVLSPIEKVPALLRPQEPKRPLPYSEEEVAYTSQPSGVKLAGTLTMPRSGGPFPGVVLITGSGPEDRDETVFGHRPFLILSDHLTRQGIAVLRVDDRGVGGSSAGPAGATTDDLVADVLAGVAFLKSRKGIDPARIGLVGHSEGGIIAPLAASRSKDLAFIVLMAGPGLPGEEILQAQSALIMKAEGATSEQIDKIHSINAKVYGILKEEKDAAIAESRIRKELAAAPDMPEEAIAQTSKAVLSPWFRYFLTYDPRPSLAQVKLPILAINGERDLQVPAKENIAAIRTALEAAGHKDHTLLVLPGLNHLFQECKTGSPSEYASIEQTFSPTALSTISDWILARSASKPAEPAPASRGASLSR